MQTNRLISLADAETNFQRSVRGSCHTALSYDVIDDALSCFHLLKLIWFDTLISDHQSLALLHVLCINYVSDQTFGLGLKFETFVSAKDKVTQCISNELPGPS